MYLGSCLGTGDKWTAWPVGGIGDGRGGCS